MADQLSLRLEPVLPRLPVELRPMLPRPASGPFDSPDHLFEPNWGGERALAFLEPEAPRGRRLRLIDTEGRDLAPLLPELDELPARVQASSAVLDGELVVVDRHGRADAGALRVRLAGPGLTIGRPVAYLAFDILVLDGRPLLALPLERRRRLLAETLMVGPEAVALPAIAAEGRALYDAVAAQGLAGVMARHRRSPYLSGVRSGLWRFIDRGAVTEHPGAGNGPDRIGDGPTGAAGDGPVGSADGDDLAPEGRRRAVLALISRLPLDLDDPEA